MKYRIFKISTEFPGEGEEELNKFLGTVKLVNCRWEFVPNGENSFWTVLVTHMSEKKETFSPKKAQVDYRDELTPEDFALYSKLRSWRNQTAEAENLPAFAVFTNDQIAQMAKKRPKSSAGLRKIDGVGDIRIEKYAEKILDIIREENALREKDNEKKNKSVPPDSPVGKSDGSV